MSEWDPFDDRPRRRRRKTVTRKKRRRTDPFGYEEERPRRRRSTTVKKSTRKKKPTTLGSITARKVKRVAKRAVGIVAYDPDNLKSRSRMGRRFSLRNVKHNIRRIKHQREDEKLHKEIMRKKARESRAELRRVNRLARERDRERFVNSVKGLFRRKKRNQNTPPPDPFD